MGLFLPDGVAILLMRIIQKRRFERYTKPDMRSTTQGSCKQRDAECECVIRI